MSQKARFDIEQHNRDGRYALILSGDLDLEAAPQLERTIQRLCTAGALEIELDLRKLAFIDSSGLRAILTAQEDCAKHRSQFFVIPSEHAGQRKLFEVTGLVDVLPWREAQHPRAAS